MRLEDFHPEPLPEPMRTPSQREEWIEGVKAVATLFTMVALTLLTPLVAAPFGMWLVLEFAF
jgi:hypothetical protein